MPPRNSRKLEIEKKLKNPGYTFTDVRLPGEVSPDDFHRGAVLARINREAGRKKRPQARSDSAVDDASLDARAKSLRENGPARPKP